MALQWVDTVEEWVDTIQEWIDPEELESGVNAVPLAAILLQVDLAGGADWLDTADHYWLDTADHFWSDGVVLRASQEGYGDINYWGDYIVSVDPPQWQTATLYGGYCSLGWGSVRFAQEFFDNAAVWPPPKKLPVRFFYTPDYEINKELIFEGIMHLSSWDRTGVSYTLHGSDYSADLLEEAEDYNGDTVVLPRAFGDIEYREPVRLPDVGGNPTYHLADLWGNPSAGWYVYDDGVNISANAVNNGDGTFHLTESPIGTVTISGHGTTTVIEEVFQWAANRLGLNLDTSLVSTAEQRIDFWADSQVKLMDFMSGFAASRCHLFYILGGTLYLVHMATNNGNATYTEHDVGPVEYLENPPVSVLRSKWTAHKSVSTPVQEVQAVEKETAVTSSYPYGNETEIEMYHHGIWTGAAVNALLTTVLGYLHASNAVVTIPMDTASLPLPGKAITFSESAESDGGPHVRGITGTIRARTIAYDFLTYTLRITGEGTIAAS